jgi:hypothetical protein
MFCFTSNVGSTKGIFTGENREKHIEFQENWPTYVSIGVFLFATLQICIPLVISRPCNISYLNSHIFLEFLFIFAAIKAIIVNSDLAT